MRLHLVGFPRPVLGFSAKLERFQRMGWGDRLSVYNGDEGTEASPEWPDEEAWNRFNAEVLGRLKSSADPGDLLLLTAGTAQSELACGAGLTALEYGIGYSGVLADTLHAFESTPWRHHVYGREGWDCRPYDTVIPGFFDAEDFPGVTGGGEFLLFSGRVTHDKGPQVAIEIARRLGMPIVVAGPGDTEWLPQDGDVSYAGFLEQRELYSLMSLAAAVIVPTLYVEPFGNVAVEAMMCGTPVVASDWGAFTETVDEGVTGYRFSTIREGEDAVQRAIRLDRGKVRHRARSRFSLEAVKPRYEAWFDRIESLWEGGYYAPSYHLEAA